MSTALAVGSRLPAFHTALGRAQLGYLDDAEIWRRLRTLRIEAYTPYTITDLQALFDRVCADREQGFSIVDEELERGLRSIAVPVLDRTGQAVGAINLVRRMPPAPRATRCARNFCPSSGPSRSGFHRCRDRSDAKRHAVRVAALSGSQRDSIVPVRFPHTRSDIEHCHAGTRKRSIPQEGTMAKGTKARRPAARPPRQSRRKPTAAATARPSRGCRKISARCKPAKPQTGAEYLESLRDGREVYIYGERVKDVTTHPAFRNTARMVARLYDALHDDKRKNKLLLPTDTGNGGLTHAFFKAPKTMADLIAGRDAIAEWARITYGWIGRAPDYKAAFLATLGANADFYEPYQDNARRWYSFSQERVPFINHAIIHPPVDRDRPPNEVADVCVHVEKETDAGLIISGAKVVATGSALTNYTFIAHHGLIPVQDKNFAAVFMLPTNAPGVKFLCRTSYEMTATVMGSPFDYPLSSPPRRERRGLHHGQGAGALGERVRLRRRREGQQFLPAHRLPAALRRAWLHAARRQARFHRRPAAQGRRGRRHQGLSRRAGQCRRGDRLAQSVLGTLGRDGARPEAVDRRLCPAEHGSRQRLPDHRHHGLYARSSISSSRPSPRA